MHHPDYSRKKWQWEGQPAGADAAVVLVAAADAQHDDDQRQQDDDASG